MTNSPKRIKITIKMRKRDLLVEKYNVYTNMINLFKPLFAYLFNQRPRCKQRGVKYTMLLIREVLPPLWHSSNSRVTMAIFRIARGDKSFQAISYLN